MTGSYWFSLRISYANTGILVLSHLSQLGLRVNWEKSKLLKTQRISFLSMELDSVDQIVRLTQERAQPVLNCLNMIKSSMAVPLNQFQRLLGPLYMRPPQHRPHGRVPRWAWQRGTGSESQRSAPKPSPHGQNFRFFGECPWNRSPGMLWFTRMPPPLAGGPRSMGLLCRGFGRVPNCTGTPRVAGSTPGLELSQEALTRSARTILRPLRTSTDKVVYAPVTCRNSPATFSSGVWSIWGRFAPLTFQVCSTGQPTSCHELRPRRVETPSPDGQLTWRRFGLAQVDLFASLETFHFQLFYSLSERTLGTDALAHSLPWGLRKYVSNPVSLLAQTLCKIREDEEQVLLVAPNWPLGPGSRSWCSSWQPLLGGFLWGRKYWLRDEAPCGTRVQTSGNFMSKIPWTGCGGSRWPTPRGSQHHHFGESTVYETRLHLEVELVHRMVLFSGSAWSESYCPFCSKGWSEGCLSPSLKPMWLQLLPTTTPNGWKVGGEAWLGHQVP